jgi:hypothetical protein
MKQYREISTDAELELVLAGCDCDGFDIVKSFRKATRYSVEHGACLCGLRRGRRKPQGGWSIVIDESTHAPISCTGVPEGENINKF